MARRLLAATASESSQIPAANSKETDNAKRPKPYQNSYLPTREKVLMSGTICVQPVGHSARTMSKSDPSIRVWSSA